MVRRVVDWAPSPSQGAFGVEASMAVPLHAENSHEASLHAAYVNGA